MLWPELIVIGSEKMLAAVALQHRSKFCYVETPVTFSWAGKIKPLEEIGYRFLSNIVAIYNCDISETSWESICYVDLVKEKIKDWLFYLFLPPPYPPPRTPQRQGLEQWGWFPK